MSIILLIWSFKQLSFSCNVSVRTLIWLNAFQDANFDFYFFSSIFPIFVLNFPWEDETKIMYLIIQGCFLLTRDEDPTFFSTDPVPDPAELEKYARYDLKSR